MDVNKARTSVKADLHRLFSGKLKVQLQALDTVRQQAVKRLLIACIVVPVVSLLGFAYIQANYMDPDLIFWVVGLSAMLMYWFVMSKWSSYRRDYKTQVVGKLLSTFNSSFKYAPTGQVSSVKYKDSGLYPRAYDRYEGEDYVIGKLGKTLIEFSELHTQYKTTTRDSKGRTTTNWHTIFKGLFFVADANKHFKSKTYIRPDSSGLFSSLGKSIGNLLGTRDARVALEDPEFERFFEVYSNDQVEARYLISPALMRRLIAFRQEADASVALSFVGGQLYIAIPTRKAYFEPKLFKPAVNMDVIEEIYQDLDFITGIVEDLDLNTRIWTKE
ncbi:DUF3137 domain-containing protein [Bowmanella sp. Y26]|uniref:DUF3137 domain-containing protein n=1 Tax=Bowmanella yangjiangensis TaxID=2811230 RepID=UPI001BDC299E|nr:DUF3137 domain-containing protein [Bowmanella yangjiangensis]MBT1062501.1 DUF3137 domain-containing protein [Bowmanella yangjiangensis]